MQRDGQLFVYDIAAFYVVGLGLLLFNYGLDRRGAFLFVLLFWMKMTSIIVAFGLLYWFYCIIATSCGLPPKAPLRFLRRVYLVAGACLLILQVGHGQPSL